jgi:hypothetical protein
MRSLKPYFYVVHSIFTNEAQETEPWRYISLEKYNYADQHTEKGRGKRERKE